MWYIPKKKLVPAAAGGMLPWSRGSHLLLGCNLMILRAEKISYILYANWIICIPALAKRNVDAVGAAGVTRVTPADLSPTRNFMLLWLN